MFIVKRLPRISSAKSEIPGISLFAQDVQKVDRFYKHYVPTARFRPDFAEDYF